jgi:hypothetical protein
MQAWVRTRNPHAVSGHDGTSTDEHHIGIATFAGAMLCPVVVPDCLSQGARDRISQLVSKTARHIIIPSFPSADCLGKLIKLGTAKRWETDAWTRAYAFASEKSGWRYSLP